MKQDWECPCEEILMPHSPQQHDFVARKMAENPGQQFVIEGEIVYAVEPEDFIKELNNMGLDDE